MTTETEHNNTAPQEATSQATSGKGGLFGKLFSGGGFEKIFKSIMEFFSRLTGGQGGGLFAGLFGGKKDDHATAQNTDNSQPQQQAATPTQNPVNIVDKQTAAAAVSGSGIQKANPNAPSTGGQNTSTGVALNY